MTQVVEHMPSKSKALCSNSSITKQSKTKKKEKKEILSDNIRLFKFR
jgi:hypothetical protein